MRGEAVERLPGAQALLTALEGLPPAYLVGGAVRDLLRGEDAIDLDVAIEGDALAAARALAERLGGRAVEHDRFGTATVRSPALTVDLARTRRERYSSPGALPDVEAAPLADDLARRDFTINAMALGLSGEDIGRLHDPHDGRADLQARVIRVLHDQSFVDDPTRLLRALRYEARLGGRLEPQTERLAREAIAGKGLRTVSGARIRDELMDLLSESAAPNALSRMHELGVDAALQPELVADPARADAARSAAQRVGADPALATLAAFVGRSPDSLIPWLDTLHLTREQVDRVGRAAAEGPRLAHELSRERPPSKLYELLEREPPEALALALALGAPEEPVARYLERLRDVRLEIGGDDLIAAGVPESPALGEALRETLRRKLDGEVSGRDAELRLALELARGDAG